MRGPRGPRWGPRDPWVFLRGGKRREEEEEEEEVEGRVGTGGPVSENGGDGVACVRKRERVRSVQSIIYIRMFRWVWWGPFSRFRKSETTGGPAALPQVKIQEFRLKHWIFS